MTTIVPARTEFRPPQSAQFSGRYLDARYPQDFTAGHLAGAINIPPSTSLEQCQKTLEQMPASNRILLYCQSNGCPYSEIVARKLIGLGYSNILYFRDGWVAWEKYQQNTGP